jgi:hypothetical protein
LITPALKCKVAGIRTALATFSCVPENVTREEELSCNRPRVDDRIQCGEATRKCRRASVAIVLEGPYDV